MRINVVGPSYDTGIPNHQAQKCVNWYPETDRHKDDAPAKHTPILRPTPGITSLFDFGDFSHGRAAITIQDIAYVIIDDTFIQLESDGTPSYIDVLSTSSGYVSMRRGASGILIADNVNAYYYDLLTLTFDVITDTHTAYPTQQVSGDPCTPSAVVYLDGWYVMTFNGSQQFNYSTDPTDWPLLQFASVNSDPDFLVTCVADHEQLWFFGTNTSEVWVSSGSDDSPFVRYSGTVLTKGCAAGQTVVAANNTFYWLAKDEAGKVVVCTARGLAPAVISHDINDQLATYTVTNDAFAFYHRVGYHEFYVLTFPTEDVTWVFDAAEEQWHQRTSIVSLDPTVSTYSSEPQAHRASAHTAADGRSYVLDNYTGAVAMYDEDVYTEFDMSIRRQRRTSIVPGDLTGSNYMYYRNQMSSYYNLILDVETGVGTGQDDQGNNPVIGLSVSKDGGYTWGPTLYRELGQQGEHLSRVKWDILGQARDMFLDFQVTDPVKATILGATVDIEKGTV